MKAPRLVTVIGTRPEAIKVAPVVVAARRTGLLEPVVVATGQHDELVDRALEPFGVPIDHRIALGDRVAGSQAELLGRLLPHLESQLQALSPDAVLVQGDTASALAGALAAVWQRVPVVHLEAGLRSHDVANPFPEETYRRLIGDLAQIHLAPTAAAVANLRAEGISDDAILCIGNTVVDAALHAAQHQSERTPAPPDGRRLVLLTVHRRENWGAPLQSILAAVHQLIERFGDVEVVAPAHPNPIVRGALVASAEGSDRFRVIEPLDHPALIAHLRAATLVLTDSGGIQEEAPTFGTPTLVLRETTERPEAVEAGCACLVGTETRAIVERASVLLADEGARSQMTRVSNPFGDGRSGHRAVEAVTWMLGCRPRPVEWHPRLDDRVGTPFERVRA